MRRLLRYGANWGIRDFVLNLHYLPETITAHVGDGADLGVRVRYSFESPVLGSAGGPRKALSAAAGRAVFHHQRRHADQRGSRTRSPRTIARPARSSPSRSFRTTVPTVTAACIVDSSGRFHSVVPPGSHVRSYHVVGVQMAHPSAFARLPAERAGRKHRRRCTRSSSKRISVTSGRFCATPISGMSARRPTISTHACRSARPKAMCVRSDEGPLSNGLRGSPTASSGTT